MEQNGGKVISQVKVKLAVVVVMVEVTVDQMDQEKINGPEADQTKPKMTRIGRVHMAR